MSGPVASGSRPAIKEEGKKRILTPDLLKDFLPSRVFPDAVTQNGQSVGGGKKQITSLCFEDTGRTCVTSGEDDLITYWDVLSGKKKAVHGSSKYGANHVTATHERGVILHASTRENDDVRLHVSEKDRYLRYFSGHTSRVGSISMNPMHTTFLTGAQDGTVLLWDLRADKAQGRLNIKEGPCLTDWDPTGMVFAVALPDPHYICLYSYNSLDKAPFEYNTIDDPELDKYASPRRNPYITSIRFSNDGRYLLVGTSGMFHYVLDSYDLSVIARLAGHEGLEKDKQGDRTVRPVKGLSGAEVCWTPDSRFVMSGSWDGRICVWDLSPPEGHERLPKPQSMMENVPAPIPTFNPCALLNEEKSGGTCRAVAFSPKYMVFASAGDAMAMWLPGKKAAEEDDGDQMDVKMH